MQSLRGLPKMDRSPCLQKRFAKLVCGELLARLEALKEKLRDLEGLFSADRKIALPRLASHQVGLICGRNTDAEKDVVENARRRSAIWCNLKSAKWQCRALRPLLKYQRRSQSLEANPDVECHHHYSRGRLF
jgi:exodeoxyribonuclease VII large subunit